MQAESMKCIVHFLPAKSGDCFVLEFSNKDCVLIDCGYRSTYEQELRPLLFRLARKGCKIILMIVTHVDQDHIDGAIRLIAENGNYDVPNIIKIENIWYNGFFNTLFMRPEFAQRRKHVIGDKQRREREQVLIDLQMQEMGEDGNISAKQGSCFEELCAKHGYPLNNHFVDRIVKSNGKCRGDILKRGIQIGECMFYVLAPNDKCLDDLAHQLNVELIRNFGYNYEITNDIEFAKLFEMLMKLQAEPLLINEEIAAKNINLETWLNTSNMSEMNAVNKASIVVEIVYEDLHMLFTADSESANWANFLKDNYDLIKLSHHGTAKPNVSLLEKTQGNMLLISTNGGKMKRHPEDELLARAILAQNRKLFFNYNIVRKDDLLDIQQKYEFCASFGEREIIL